MRYLYISLYIINNNTIDYMSFSLIISIYNTYYFYVLWLENTLLTRKKFVNDEDDDDDDKASCIKEALEKFSAIWRPEAEAIRLIAFHGLDLREFNHSIYSKFKIIKMVVVVMMLIVMIIMMMMIVMMMSTVLYNRTIYLRNSLLNGFIGIDLSYM